MPYREEHFGTTKLINRKGNLLSGSNDAIFLKNKYQPLLDDANAAVVNQVHYIEERSNLAKEFLHKAQGLKRSIDAHTSELTALETILESLLDKQFGQEYKMWKENTQGLNIKTTEGISTNAIGILGTANSTPSLKYLEKYPEHSEHPSIKSAKNSLENKREDIRKATIDYIEAVSKYNTEISGWPKEITKADAKFLAYDAILNEATNKISNSRYPKSIFYKIASEEIKADVNIDTLKHRINQFKNTLEVIKKEYSEYKQTILTELDYN